MKTNTILSFSAVVALASIFASIGCSPAPIQSYADDDEDQESEVKSTKKKSNDDDDDKSTKKKSNTDDEETTSSSSSSSSSSGGASSGEPPTSSSSTSSSGGASSGEVPPGEGDEECFMQCIATKGAANTYVQCSMNCQDEQCDENCWQQSCASQEDACITALEGCDSQCGFGPPPGQ